MIEATSLVSVKVMWGALIRHSHPHSRNKQESFEELVLPSFSSSNKELSPNWASTEAKGMDFSSHLIIMRQSIFHFSAREMSEEAS